MAIKRKAPPRNIADALKNVRRAFRFKPIEADQAITKRGQGGLGVNPASPVNFIIWNVCKGLGGARFFSEFSFLLQRADFFLMQEALLDNDFRSKFFMPDRSCVHGCSYIRSDGARDGVMTISKSEPVFLERYLCLQSEPIMGTPKAALLSIFPIVGQQDGLLIVNIHSTLIRSVPQSIIEIERFLPFLQQHQGPIVFAGDFNTVTPVYLEALRDALVTVGLELLNIPDDPRGRFASLDHFFFRGLRPRSCQVLAEFSTSDHFPLLASFDLIG